MKKKYDIVYSLGASCGCAIHMQKSFLRNYSGPFDWLYGGDLETRVRLICNNFEGFIDEKYFVQLEGVCKKCDQYHNTHTDLKFIHDFLHEIPFEMSFIQIKEKYERRIARFYELVQKSNDVLLIWFQFGTNPTEDEKIIRLCDEVCKKFNKTISFLIIEEDKNITDEHFIPIKIQDNIMRYSFKITQEITSSQGDKELIKIFKQYRTRKTRKQKIQFYCAKILSEALPALVPVSSYRKKLRSKILSCIAPFYSWKHGN